MKIKHLLLASCLLLFTGHLQAQKKAKGPKLGAITYSFRSMPHTLDQLIEFCQQSGVKHLELMGDPMEEYAGKPKAPFRMGPPARGGARPSMTDEQRAQMAAYSKEVAAWRETVGMEKFVEARKKFEAAGIKIYAFKPNAFGPNNSDAEVAYGMRAAKALGASSVTLEMPTDAAQTLRLGKLGEQNSMNVGYHAHLQATDVLWDQALAQSKNNTINLDAGHYIAVGGNNTKEALLAFIEKNHKRISSMHCKDRTTPEHGQGNVVWGKGDTPIVEMLQLIKKKKYKFPIAVELEYEIPEGSDAVKEVAKCIAYAQKALE